MENELLIDHENAERILEEGWRLFQQKGYRGVTLDELCAGCHLSKPTLYYYFQDKENLFVHVLQYKLQEFRKAVEQSGTPGTDASMVAGEGEDFGEVRSNADALAAIAGGGGVI